MIAEPLLAAPLRPPLTVADARRALAEKFRAARLDSPELDARVLVGHVTGLNHSGLATAARAHLDAGQIRLLEEFTARRLAGEPIARIVGIKEFWGLPLKISPATFVPRPETETVVEAAAALIDAASARQRNLRIADLGTGSGAILLALLSEFPYAFGIGTDVSPEAITIARENAARLGLSLRAAMVVTDFGSSLAGRFDLVVANPPYVATADIAALAPEVRYDPLTALDGGADGLAAYRAIAADARRLLAPEGLLVLELGAGQEDAVTKLLRTAGLKVAPAWRDLSGIARALPASVATMTR
ncbi:MAG TPA: peptide chain release factor N(5)-glutamine methyltransferase [Xanthobacteraceae bacterium]|nr:peptide chain release factor N(5)-glutamine methyltransferase [Xanthobacteraceae bacterium]